MWAAVLGDRLCVIAAAALLHYSPIYPLDISFLYHPFTGCFHLFSTTSNSHPNFNLYCSKHGLFIIATPQLSRPARCR